MKNNKSKSGSIRLITIINILLIMTAMMYTISLKYENVQIAKKEKLEKENQIQVATVAKTENNETEVKITSRSLTTSRHEVNTNETVSTEVITEEPKEEVLEEIQEQEIEYIKIEDIKISKSMDLTVRTGLSREGFIELISRVKYDKSGFFEENAGTIYDLCKEYEINEIFFCGLISAESGWNIASNHRRTYNYISLMKNGKLIQYSSVEDGLETAAKKLHDNYLTPGGKFYHGKTLSGVKTRFCPASSTWVDLVYGRMKQIV